MSKIEANNAYGCDFSAGNPDACLFDDVQDFFDNLPVVELNRYAMRQVPPSIKYHGPEPTCKSKYYEEHNYPIPQQASCQMCYVIREKRSGK